MLPLKGCPKSQTQWRHPSHLTFASPTQQPETSVQISNWLFYDCKSKFALQEFHQQIRLCHQTAQPPTDWFLEIRYLTLKEILWILTLLLEEAEEKQHSSKMNKWKLQFRQIQDNRLRNASIVNSILDLARHRYNGKYCLALLIWEGYLRLAKSFIACTVAIHITLIYIGIWNV